MTAQIRSARPDDVPGILALVRELAEYERSLHEVTATEDDLRAALFGDHPAVHCHVIEQDDELAGFAVWFLNFSTWLGRHGIYLEDLFVRPQHRGLGYGRALLLELARIADERGYRRVEWWVLDWNESAHGFYRRLGAAPRSPWCATRRTAAASRAAPNRPG